jgi:hypothetical protein
MPDPPPYNVCTTPLDFEHDCDQCRRLLRPPFIVTRCNHTFCGDHANAHWVHLRKCLKCGSHLRQRTPADDVAAWLSRKRKLLVDRVRRLGIAWCAAWLLVLLVDLPMLGSSELATSAAAALLLLLVLGWPHARPVELCVVGAAKGAGVTTVCTFLDSDLEVGPVFTPSVPVLGRRGPGRLRTVVCDRATPPGEPGTKHPLMAVLTDVPCHCRRPDDETLDASALHAIRWGDDLSATWGAARGRLPCGHQPNGRDQCCPVWQASFDAADGILFVIDLREFAREFKAAKRACLNITMASWVNQYIARERREFESACEQSDGRPMLILCNKGDRRHVPNQLWGMENPPVQPMHNFINTETFDDVQRLCVGLGLRHGTAGARLFVHAASLGRGPHYLPEEIRKRIFENATTNGAYDAAIGHTLRLESGSAVRVHVGGVIGDKCAVALREGVGWLTEEANHVRRHTDEDEDARAWMRRRHIGLALVALVVLSVWCGIA